MSKSMRREMVNPASIREAARALYERHGGSALAIAHERAERLSCGSDFPVLDTALLILTEVERLVGRTQRTLHLQYAQPR